MISIKNFKLKILLLLKLRGLDSSTRLPSTHDTITIITTEQSSGLMRNFIDGLHDELKFSVLVSMIFRKY